MRIALGLKAHSGWAALVAIGKSGGNLQVVDRRRLELVDHLWAKAPYHAAEKVAPDKARALVKRATEEVYRVSEKALRAAVTNLGEHDVVACAVLTPNPMPDWTTDEILAVHFRMHKAEGVLFPSALARAATACGLKLLAVPENEMDQRLISQVTALGKSVGAPWARDQKNAALAAITALRAP